MFNFQVLQVLELCLLIIVQPIYSIQLYYLFRMAWIIIVMAQLRRWKGETARTNLQQSFYDAVQSMAICTVYGGK